jgi:uncharacterized cupin superfamily protein
MATNQTGALRAPALDPTTVAGRQGSKYPTEPLRAPFLARIKQPLGDALGLENFGVNLVRLPPGTVSSLRHWHTRQDEFVYILEGELVLVSEAGEQTLRPGMCAGFPANRADGHHLINRSAADAVYLEVGDRLPGDRVHYPDVDLDARLAKPSYEPFHKDGTKY